jgi:dTDP-4-dehydrorhamnose 3,5-epimerase
MQKFSFNPTRFEGVYLVKPFVSEDNRGVFIKDYSLEVFNQNGLDYELKEVFYTESQKGVIRAIHFQSNHEQPKLVRCVSGKIYDVVVDLRVESETYGQYIGFILSGENKDQLLIPEHFGHGYLVLEDSIVSYKCAEKFYPEDDDGIIWNDKDINIEWPLDLIDEVILSTRDESLQSFKEFTQKVKK